jgi:hypothetical protein
MPLEIFIFSSNFEGDNETKIAHCQREQSWSHRVEIFHLLLSITMSFCQQL